MNDVLSELRGEMESVLSASNALTNLEIEANNKCSIQIGKNNTVYYMYTGLDLFGSGKDNLYYMIDKCVSMLKSNDVSGLSKYISEIQAAQSSVLSFETVIGASINRMDLISTRYESSEYNYLEMFSDAIDADMAQSITQLITALTVYNAALAAGAEIIKTSLLDFLK
jgi:flagellar hook-associated protein 3 FlgL